MQSDPMQVWRTLTSHYAKMTDGELLNLAADFGDLTDVARGVLRDEMRKRGLGDPQQNVPKETGRPDGGPGGEADSPEAFVWKADLCDCNSEDEAWQICEVLRGVGIESWTDDSRNYSSYLPVETGTPLDMGSSRIRVFVPADRLEEARGVLVRSTPAHIASNAKAEQEAFEPPVCPACGAPDPVLEGVDPSNCWRCEVCGKQWSDRVEEVGEMPGEVT